MRGFDRGNSLKRCREHACKNSKDLRKCALRVAAETWRKIGGTMTFDSVLLLQDNAVEDVVDTSSY